MEAFLSTFGLVALAEMGDKTQILALVLSSRFRRPWPVAAGIAVATLVNHLLAGAVGIEVGQNVPQIWLKWGLGLSFLAMAAWTLIPDKFASDDRPTNGAASTHQAFLGTLVSFFLVEMGDKTQIATMVLAAQFKSVPLIVAGSTIGVVAADIPVILLGDRLIRRIPACGMRWTAAGLFGLFGVAILFGW